MALLASNVNLPPDLNSVFSGIGTKAYNKIGSNYGGAMAKAGQDASAQGFGGPLDYTKERLGTQEGLDIGNLETGLESGLGNTGYQNTLNQRNFNQQKQIADLIGDASAPSVLEQIFSGIGGGAQAGGNLLPFFKMMNKSGNGGQPLSVASGYGGGDEEGYL